MKSFTPAILTTLFISIVSSSNVLAISCTGQIWGGGGTTVEVQDRISRVNAGEMKAKVRYKAKVGRCVNGAISISGQKWWANNPSRSTLEKTFGVKLRLHRDFGAGDGGSVNTIRAYKVE